MVRGGRSPLQKAGATRRGTAENGCNCAPALGLGEGYRPASESGGYTEADGRERLKLNSGARTGWGLRARFRKRALHRGRRLGTVEIELRR